MCSIDEVHSLSVVSRLLRDSLQIFNIICDIVSLFNLKMSLLHCFIYMYIYAHSKMSSNHQSTDSLSRPLHRNLIFHRSSDNTMYTFTIVISIIRCIYFNSLIHTSYVSRVSLSTAISKHACE